MLYVCTGVERKDKVKKSNVLWVDDPIYKVKVVVSLVSEQKRGRLGFEFLGSFP